jgi:hypothetical protein
MTTTVESADHSPRAARASLPEFLANREAFAVFVATWEAGHLPVSDWTHAAHVAVGACYIVRDGALALDRLREGIKRHNNAAALRGSPPRTGYHETLTRFWCERLSESSGSKSDPYLAAAAAVERFGEARELHRTYYSFDVVRSSEARAAWVPPDLVGPC